jgi:hypothetical protein
MNETDDDERTTYIEAARAAIHREDPKIGKYLTPTCPECDERPYDDEGDDGSHIVISGFIVIGCEGYWAINPNALGIDHPNWTNAKGE